MQSMSSPFMQLSQKMLETDEVHVFLKHVSRESYLHAKCVFKNVSYYRSKVSDGIKCAWRTELSQEAAG